LTGVSIVLLGSCGPMGASMVVARDRHLATVVRLKPYRRGHRSGLSTLGARLELAALCGRCREEYLP
jgi:hypothetical protein